MPVGESLVGLLQWAAAVETIGTVKSRLRLSPGKTTVNIHSLDDDTQVCFVFCFGFPLPWADI